MKRIKFTLIEMVVVVAIIIMLLAMLLPVLLTVKENAKIEETRTFMKDLITGIENFKTTYNGYPFWEEYNEDVRIDISGASPSATGVSYQNLMDILGEGSTNTIRTEKNPRDIGFINLRNDTYLDSWGEEFYICINMNGDEQIDSSRNTSYVGGAIKADIGIYSTGPDLALGTDDDIVSWER